MYHSMKIDIRKWACMRLEIVIGKWTCIIVEIGVGCRSSLILEICIGKWAYLVNVDSDLIMDNTMYTCL